MMIIEVGGCCLPNTINSPTVYFAAIRRQTLPEKLHKRPFWLSKWPFVKMAIAWTIAMCDGNVRCWWRWRWPKVVLGNWPFSSSAIYPIIIKLRLPSFYKSASYSSLFFCLSVNLLNLYPIFFWPFSFLFAVILSILLLLLQLVLLLFLSIFLLSSYFLDNL